MSGICSEHQGHEPSCPRCNMVTTVARAGLWRTGRTVGRTIYRIVGDEPSTDDVLIGMMDTPKLARQVVIAVNERLLYDEAVSADLNKELDRDDRPDA